SWKRAGGSKFRTPAYAAAEHAVRHAALASSATAPLCRGLRAVKLSCCTALALGIPSIRLACQLRPQTDVAVIPVLPPHIGADFVRNRRRINIGEERYVVSMFVDMRGSTKLSEERLPFDIVFLITRFVDAASHAVTDAG